MAFSLKRQVGLVKQVRPVNRSDLLIDILIILLLGLLSITWFRGDYLISGGDFGMPLDWVKYLKSMSSVWMEAYSLGSPDSRNIASLIPYALFGGIMQSLGFSLVFIEKILFYWWFVASGLSMYFLCSVLGMKRLGRLFASIFYMLNPFSLIVIWHVSHALIQMPYVFAPLYLGLYIYGLKNKKGFDYIFIVCLIWLFTTTSAYAWSAAVAIHYIPIFFYFLSFLVFNSRERIFAFKYSFLFVLSWLALNFYWLYPFVTTITQEMKATQYPVLMSDIETLKLTSVKITEAIRMLGYWALHSGYKGEPYYTYEKFYDSRFIIGLSFLIPLMVILGFLSKEVRKKQFLFFSVLVISFGLFGMKGPYPPFGGLLIWLYQKIPALALLTRFTVLFYGIPTYIIFGVLVGYGFLFIYEYGRKFIGFFIYPAMGTMAVLLFVVLVFPFWNGEVIREETKISPGERVKVPDYWWEAKKWLSKQNDFFRILPLPMSKTYNVEFAWEKGYGGGDLTRWLTNQPVLNVNTGDSFRIPELIGNLIEKEKEFKDVTKLLGFLNVKYLLFREDIRWDYILGHQGWFVHNPDNLKKFIAKQKDLILEKKFDKLSFFKTKDEFLLPRVYSPQSLDFIDGKVDSLTSIIQFLSPEKKESFLLLEQNQKRTDEIWQENYFGKILIWKEPIFYDEKTKGLTPTVYYEINVPKEGQYDLFLADDGLTKYYSPKENSLLITLDNQNSQKVSLKSFDVNLIYLGKIALDKGTHKLSILVPEARNLIPDASFEKGLWDGPIDVYPEDPLEKKYILEHSLDAFEGKFSLRLGSYSHSPAVFAPIDDFRMSDIYQVTFAAKNITGNQPYFAIWESPSKVYPPLMDFSYKALGEAGAKTMLYLQSLVETGPAWKKMHLIFQTQPTTQSAGVFFTSLVPRGSMGETINLYDEVKVERAFTNPILLRYESESNRMRIPEISFKKLQPSKFEVKVTGATEPYFLVFSESFHPKWKSSIEAEHLIINGFANGWYIPKLGDYKFTIYFEPQKVYYFSIGVSLAAFILSMFYLLFLRLKSKIS